MAFVIAAPASGTGKTLLSLALLSWCRSKGLTSQPFKVGPDYLDAEYLSEFSLNPCRNLDLVLCGPEWVKNSFYGYGCSADTVLVEGVMGLFDGIGSSEEGSTASIAKHLDLPVVLVLNASGQAASIAALVKGFILHDPEINIAGVVLNYVSTSRHRKLLTDVLESIGVKVLGCLPRDSLFELKSRNLGLIPVHNLNLTAEKLSAWVAIAERFLDVQSFRKLLTPPIFSRKPIEVLFEKEINEFALSPPLPVAIAEDEAFHFRYQDTKDCLESLGMPILPWSPLANEKLPKQAKGLIIPGGFPEQYACDLSNCNITFKEISSAIGRIPTYAECGGMMLLGQSITSSDGRCNKMAGILPFKTSQGSLEIGYRYLSGISSSLIVSKGQAFVGHEFHRWQINRDSLPLDTMKVKKSTTNHKLEMFSPWEIKGTNKLPINEGWANNKLHASWVHLHWASQPSIPISYRNALEQL